MRRAWACPRLNGVWLDDVGTALGHRRRRSLRVPDPKDRVQKQRCVKDKTSGYGGTKPRNAEFKPIHGCKPCTCTRNQPHGIGVHRRDSAAEALTDKKQAEAQPEAQIRWSNNPKILRADALYFGVVAE